MIKLTYFSQTVWLPLFLAVALISISASPALAQKIEWRQDLAAAKAEARDTNRLVWLHFTADWCVPCQRLESFVFSSTGVIRAADRNTVAVKIDADAQESLVKQLDVPRIPFDIVMTPSGRVILEQSSAKDTSNFLKMFDSLDRPLQELTDGDRTVINARIDKLHRVIQRTEGLRQKKSDLDLDGPSHEMASTTVQGQRLERGFESSKRASEIRSIEAQLLKRKAKLYIAEQEKQKQQQQPKISENPFFKTSDSVAQTTLPSNKPLPKNNSFSGNQSQSFGSDSKVISNAFVKQNKVKLSSDFVPPLAPIFGEKAANAEQDLSTFEERHEFSFGAKSPKKPVSTTKTGGTETLATLAGPKLTLPKLTEQKETLPSLLDLSDRLGGTANSNQFAYAPADELRKAVRSEAKVNSDFEKTGLNSFDNPINKTVQKAAAKTSGLSLSAPHRPAATVRSTRYQQRSGIKTFGEIERPSMKTAVSVPHAPVMVEGVVQIAETVVPAVEGRLVAAEQSIGGSSLVRNDRSVDTSGSVDTSRSRDTIQKQISRTDRLLENVNFFAPDDKATQSAPKTFAVAGQAVPQSQIVINLNTANNTTSQPTQLANQAVIVQPNFTAPSNQASQVKPTGMVAQASSTTAVANQAKILNADVAAARSKYALKGKCPVTLLSKGKWVDGNKEIGCVHRDRVYLFATAAHREAFLADPDRMSPLLAGFDPVIFDDTGKLIEGNEKFGTFMGKTPNQRIVLFASADTRDRFQKEPSRYLDVVRRAMTKNAPKNTKLR